MRTFTPLHDRILVRADDAPSVTPGGIEIPDMAKKDKLLEGKVISAGNGKVLENGNLRPLEIKAGDTVLFGEYAGTKVKINDEDFLIMREEEVLGSFAGIKTEVKKLTTVR